MTADINMSASGQLVAMTPSPDALIASMISDGNPDITKLSNTVRGAIKDGSKAIAGATPAFNLISKIASAGASHLDPMEVVTAMAATVSLANPLAGAAVMAAGALSVGIEKAADSLFHALGLIADAPQPVPHIGGIRKGTDSIPYGPSASNWTFWTTFTKRESWNPIVWKFMHILGGGLGAPNDYYMGNLLGRMLSTGMSSGINGINGPIAKNAFEEFLIPLMKKNIEHWWNANPYVLPYDLLTGAAYAWNHQYNPTPNHNNALQCTPGYPCNADTSYEFNKTSWVDYITSGDFDVTGDKHDKPPVYVNLGPSTAPSRQTVSLQLHGALALNAAQRAIAAQVAAETAQQAAIGALSSANEAAINAQGMDRTQMQRIAEDATKRKAQADIDAANTAKAALQAKFDAQQAAWAVHVASITPEQQAATDAETRARLAAMKKQNLANLEIMHPGITKAIAVKAADIQPTNNKALLAASAGAVAGFFVGGPIGAGIGAGIGYLGGKKL